MRTILVRTPITLATIALLAALPILAFYLLMSPALQVGVSLGEYWQQHEHVKLMGGK